MARREGPDPFDQTSNDSLQVESGLFTSAGRDRGRTGASNARAAGGGPGARWRSSSQQRRVNLVTLLIVVLVVVIVLPMLISFVGANRREAIAAADAAGVQPVNVVVIDADVQAAADSSSPVLGAYAMSSAFVADETSDEMQQRIEAVSSSVIDNNAGETQSLSDDSISYFTGTYAPELVSMVPEHKANWSAMNWDTSTEIDTAAEQVNTALAGGQLDQIANAVIQLATALGDARDEHYANRVTYVAPSPTATPDPSPSATPEETEEPEETEAPEAPEETEEPTETGGIGGGGSDPEPPSDPVDPEPTQTSDDTGNGGGNGLGNG
ncbi:hypothetical protein [Gulosibacter sp. ACHW.36C]|uniref:Uncharacterized protein n=1 Tax=Gulosibacter sediminis TaxID=1729695 RepID=A0ABY4N0M3_9MICO|nr:hypothetical protein [Gulosibacter sediminis]UQN15584.1 hypothetical protein M3M28_03750 [Gulosibacter sediminis]